MVATPILSNKVTFTIGGTQPGCIRSITPPSMSAESIDVTCHNATTNIRKFMAGLVDLGSMSATIVYDQEDVSTLYGYLKAGSSQTVIITIPTTPAETITFSGFLTALSIEASNGSDITASMTIKLDGNQEITWETAE